MFISFSETIFDVSICYWRVIIIWHFLVLLKYALIILSIFHILCYSYFCNSGLYTCLYDSVMIKPIVEISHTLCFFLCVQLVSPMWHSQFKNFSVCLTCIQFPNYSETKLLHVDTYYTFRLTCTTVSGWHVLQILFSCHFEMFF